MTKQVDDGEEGDLLKQALAMSMTDGEEFENMRVRACVRGCVRVKGGYPLEDLVGDGGLFRSADA